VKSATGPALKNDLKEILTATRPEVGYTYNLAGKYDMHIGDARIAARSTVAIPL
jgi:hypothetical protein